MIFMKRFITLSSGSNGNCYCLSSEDHTILIDAGIGVRTIKKRLADHDIDIRSVEMILITHDHADHVRGLGKLAQSLSVPIFTTSVLHNALSNYGYIDESLSGCVRVVRVGAVFEHRGVKFYPFEVPHDATQTLGYYIDFCGTKITVMTDLGYVPQRGILCASNSDYVVVESNYDVEMLLNGPYPAELKKRVLGEWGHLSNEDCASALQNYYHKGLKGIFLCHLSKENNTPELALEATRRRVDYLKVNYENEPLLAVLPRSESAEFIL